MRKKNIYVFIGTTAELIKLAPVIKEFKRRHTNFKIISSSQNVLQFNELKPIIGKQTAYYTLRLKPIKIPTNLYIQFLIWIVKAFVNHLLFFRNEFRMIDRKNSFFIVHGDTISCLLGAIVSKVYRLRLVHIESGLRSFNFIEPFPEEICRLIVSKLADIHFCPNSWAVNNLRNEGGIKINTRSNTLIEAVSVILKKVKRPYFRFTTDKKYFVLVLHRQEHMLFKKNLTKKLISIFTEYANKDLTLVLILHKLTEKFLVKEGLQSKLRENRYVILVPRLPYKDFINLVRGSEFIATDGGSNQEEAYYLGKPCLILRSRTERIEGLGKNALLSHADEQIIRDFVKDYRKYQRKPVSFTIPPSKNIVDYLLSH